MTAVDFSTHVANPLAAGPAAAAATASKTDEGFTFHDLLDIVNPLQHIPVVTTIYRAITGDQIKTFPKIAGDTLFGGVTGFLSSVADTIFEKITGKSVGDTVLAWVEDEISPASTTATAVAAGAPAAASDTSASTDTPSGKSFGDRVLAWVEDMVSPSSPATALASAAPVATSAPVATAAPAALTAAPAAVTPASLDTIVIPGQAALLMAMTRKNIDQDLAARAANAYRSTLTVSGKAAASALH
ncbi:MAG: hypothetical protein ACXWLO_01710 [Rhizomicrobium sp.]